MEGNGATATGGKTPEPWTLLQGVRRAQPLRTVPRLRGKLTHARSYEPSFTPGGAPEKRESRSSNAHGDGCAEQLAADQGRGPAHAGRARWDTAEPQPGPGFWRTSQPE